MPMTNSQPDYPDSEVPLEDRLMLYISAGLVTTILVLLAFVG